MKKLKLAKPKATSYEPSMHLKGLGPSTNKPKATTKKASLASIMAKMK